MVCRYSIGKKRRLDFCHQEVSMKEQDGLNLKKLMEVFIQSYQLYQEAKKPKTKLYLTEVSGRLNYVVPVEIKDNDVVRQLDFVYLADYEAFFEEDLREVKVHTGEFADELTRNAGAYALTLGNNIYFADGQYAPDTEEGKLLLARELAHVVQQKQGKPMIFHEDLERLEHEANKIETEVSGHGLEDHRGFTWAGERTVGETAVDSGRMDLGDFGKRSQKPLVTCVGKRGETITMTEEEYWEGIEWVRQQLKNDYAQLTTDEQRYRFLKKMRRF